MSSHYFQVVPTLEILRKRHHPKNVFHMHYMGTTCVETQPPSVFARLYFQPMKA